jgi:hypothetical protein
LDVSQKTGDSEDEDLDVVQNHEIDKRNAEHRKTSWPSTSLNSLINAKDIINGKEKGNDLSSDDDKEEYP